MPSIRLRATLIPQRSLARFGSSPSGGFHLPTRRRQFRAGIRQKFWRRGDGAASERLAGRTGPPSRSALRRDNLALWNELDWLANRSVRRFRHAKVGGEAYPSRGDIILETCA